MFAEPQHGENPSRPQQECCACGTAKYRVTFYGNWSEQIHPKDYPSKSACLLLPWQSLQPASLAPQLLMLVV